MDPQQIQLMVEQASNAFSAVFDFAFSPAVLTVWGPPFVLLLFVNMMRVALGKGYAPGPMDVERAGEREMRHELREMRK